MGKKEEHTGRNAFINALVAALFSPLSVWLGFYIAHELQRPKLAVTSVAHTPWVVAEGLPKELVSKLAGDKNLLSKLRNAFNETAHNHYEVPNSSWLNGRALGILDTKLALEAVQTARDEVDAALSSPVPTGMEKFAVPRDKLNSEFAILGEVLDSLQAIDQRPDSLQQRSGDDSLDVGVLNTGDVDGVISKEAKISFDSGSFSVFSQKYVVVKAHGYESVPFSMYPIQANDQNAEHAWSDRMKKRAAIPFTISLVTGDGKTIKYEDTLQAK